MIYELFMFNDEIDLLEIKLEEMYSFVDKFIIIEATHTHTNKSKKLWFSENDYRFRKYKDKIIHLVCTFSETDLYKKHCQKLKNLRERNDDYYRENFQRDFGIISNQIEFKDDDIIIVTDCDEIINKKNLSKWLSENELDKFYRLGMTLHAYQFNWYVPYPHVWRHAFIVKYKHIKELNTSISYMRDNYKFIDFHDSVLYNMGWHFSYQMTPSQIVNKLQNIAESIYLKDIKEEKFINDIRDRKLWDMTLEEYPITELPDSIRNIIK